MRWDYVIAHGELYDENGLRCVGYSGFGEGKNNPAMQDVPDVGPVPVGTYTLGEPENSKALGPYAIPLIPSALNRMFGRSGLFIHGDSIDFPGQASHGCVIIGAAVRYCMKQGDTLDVLADLPEDPGAVANEVQQQAA